MSLGLSLLANGVVLGGVASVMAVAFALVYAATRTFHIAQAAVFTTAGYVLFATHALWGLPLAAGVAAGALAGGLFGVLVDRGLYRTLARAGASPLVVMIGSLATVTVVDNVFGMLFTMDPRFMDTGGLKQAALRLGPVSWTWLQLGGLAAGVIGLAGLSLFLGATRAGKAVRAASANPSLASALGFPLGRLHAMVYFASSVLASLAGMYHA
ncbi:MAG: branched-chain amino acid ABC transporter permease, partial [Clostridia bacterium]|nr:branched-chain amino acid ABC transporter permease [Clostridia bacterium]